MNSLGDISVGAALADNVIRAVEQWYGVTFQPAIASVFVAPARKQTRPSMFSCRCIVQRRGNLFPIFPIEIYKTIRAKQFVRVIAQNGIYVGAIKCAKSLLIDFPDPFLGCLYN